MLIFFLLLLLVAALGLKRADRIECDYMSVDMTNSIKGFFLWLVFFSHIWGYTDFSHPLLDGLYQSLIRGRTGQCIVTMFLFYSGYGMMEAIKKKGRRYVDRIPIKRFLNVLLQFDVVIMVFWLYRYLSGTRYGVKKMLLTFIGWDGIGNSNWYIFCILWIYIFTFVAFRVFEDNHVKAVSGVFVLSILYMAIMHKLGREYWWYDTILTFSWGMVFSIYRKEIEALINQRAASWLFCLTVFCAGWGICYYYRSVNPVVYQLWVFCFVAAIVTLTMRFVVDSPLLRLSGKYLFGLYILQRLPMMILKPYMLSGKATAFEKYSYVGVCFICTIVLSIIYENTAGRAVKRIISCILNAL